jgi:hypothetical protein
MSTRCEHAERAIGGGLVKCMRLATRRKGGRLLCRAHAREPIHVQKIVTTDGMVRQRSQISALCGERPATQDELNRWLDFGEEP